MSSDTPPPVKKAAAKRAPAKKKAAPAAPAKRTEGRGVYVPALPEGWEAQITVQGPNGHSARVVPNVRGEFTIEFRTNGTTRRKFAATLKAACKELATGVKRIEQYTRDEARLKKAHDETFAGLGEPDPEPVPDPPRE